jgi:hypothetical protein
MAVQKIRYFKALSPLSRNSPLPLAWDIGARWDFAIALEFRELSRKSRIISPHFLPQVQQ